MGRGESYRALLVLEFGLKLLVIQPCGERVLRVPVLGPTVTPDRVRLRLGELLVKRCAAEVVAVLRLFLGENLEEPLLSRPARLGLSAPAAFDFAKSPHCSFANERTPWPLVR